jgi:hypothetical protein
MSKKIKFLKILIITLLLVGIVLFIYAYFDSKNSDQTIGQSIRNLFPTSNTTNPPLTPNNPGAGDLGNGGGGVIDVIPNAPDKLVQISNSPVSGGMFSSTSSVRYIERGTGNVYEYSYFTNLSQKITNTTIPKIHDSYWVDNDTFIGRYLASDNKTIRSFVGSIINPGASGTVSTIFLKDNITSISLAGDNIFYIADSFPGSVGYIYNPDQDKTSQIFRSDNEQLTTLWHNNQPFVHTNPSNNISGTLFRVIKGNLLEVLNDVPALIASSVDGELLVSSFGQTNNTFSYDTTTNSSESFASLLVPEKCVSTLGDIYCAVDVIQGNFPDSWYLGLGSFNDHIYKIKKDSGRIQVYNFTEDIPGGIDVINISTSPDGEQILFMNKKDNSLWSLNLK